MNTQDAHLTSIYPNPFTSIHTRSPDNYFARSPVDSRLTRPRVTGGGQHSQFHPNWQQHPGPQSRRTRPDSGMRTVVSMESRPFVDEEELARLQKLSSEYVPVVEVSTATHHLRLSKLRNS